MNTTLMVRIDGVKPTQGALGLEHVREKMAMTGEHSADTLPSFLRDHALRAVRGPGGSLHVIDHHHWARAWYELGFREAPVCVDCDFSALPPDEFIEAMNARGWFHPYDERGRPTSVERLPGTIAAMPDDPYLSIAAFARMAGVFEDPPEFNAKFAWADFFRTRVSGDFGTISGFAKALAQAIATSSDAAARRLPGLIA
ncbi:ParB/Srx family N-terminal domain-containing protein [Caballeronia glathei]|uniref:Chromosomal partitioning protein ParB n=1 Tax=Caballeronia glathei TaxID=60547 RepID=A0A069PDF1_9BURK|nr:ParB/Srx family N-terminal domain-containing protein [Caballeronia glathei]KDR38615.1 chromosomal partitioning protein ParB [Caballeronia glathei]